MTSVLGIIGVALALFLGGYLLGVWVQMFAKPLREAHAEEMAKHAPRLPVKPRRCTGCQCLVKPGKDDNYCRWPCSWFAYHDLFGGRVCSRQRWISRGLPVQFRHYYDKDRGRQTP